jgi:hypothetical protein
MMMSQMKEVALVEFFTANLKGSRSVTCLPEAVIFEVAPSAHTRATVHVTVEEGSPKVMVKTLAALVKARHLEEVTNFSVALQEKLNSLNVN